MLQRGGPHIESMMEQNRFGATLRRVLGIKAGWKRKWMRDWSWLRRRAGIVALVREALVMELD